MVELLGGIGFLLFISTLLPYFTRRLHIGQPGVGFFTRYHHTLALSSMVVLTLHGFAALTGRRGWQWGKLGLSGDLASGVIAWLILVAVVIFTLKAVRQKPFPRTHCWLVGLLVILVLYHVF